MSSTSPASVLGRGYFNRPELTARIYLPDPFSSLPGSRLYKTGDLARFLPDGRIEYLGRIDHQVKIRGLRVELGEIEEQLRLHPSVKECTVQALEAGGDRKLAAYLVPREHPPPRPSCAPSCASASRSTCSRPPSPSSPPSLSLPTARWTAAPCPLPRPARGKRETPTQPPRSPTEETL